VEGRILFLVDDFASPSSGGTEAQLWLLYRNIRKSRWRPRIVSLRHSSFLDSALTAEEYACLEVTSLSSPGAWLKAWRYVRRARREGFEIGHIYLNDASVLMPPLLWIVGIRVVVSRRDLGFWYTPHLLSVLRTVRAFVDLVVANCNAVKETVCVAESYPASKVEVILNGYEIPANAGPSSYRSQASVPRDAILLGLVANLRPLKRVEDAIQALAKLRSSGYEVWLLVAGEDRPHGNRSGLEVLTELAVDLGVNSRVRFLGSIADPWCFLQEVDVVLSCSDTEGLSNSIIEGMALGKPVIGTSVGGTPELIVHGVTGFLYPARDVRSLVKSLESLLGDGALRNRMGCAAYEHANARLSVDALVRQHERLYESLLPRGIDSARSSS